MAPPKPTRRTSSQAAQSTLSFHTGNSKTSKTASPASATLDAKNRVSKPISTAARSTLASAAGKKPLANLPIVAPAAQPVVEIAAPEAEPEAIVEEETEEEEEDEETTRARRVSQAQIARYWAAREAERTAPRVHQKALTVREKVLREFDMSSRYGVCCIFFFLSSSSSLCIPKYLRVCGGGIILFPGGIT